MKESNFQLHGQPNIVELNFLANNEYIENGNHNLFLDIEHQNKVDFKDKKASIKLTLFVNKNKELKEVPFTIKAQIIGNFFINDAKETELDIFLNQIGPSILLSYLRPLISQFITYSGYPPYILPLLDLRKI